MVVTRTLRWTEVLSSTLYGHPFVSPRGKRSKVWCPGSSLRRTIPPPPSFQDKFQSEPLTWEGGGRERDLPELRTPSGLVGRDRHTL